MIQENQVYRSPTNNIAGVLAGMVIGVLAGAVTMLLLAPQSGKDTRKQILEKGIELRDRSTGIMDRTMGQIRSKANKLTVGLKDRGRELALEQLEHVSDAAQAGKEAIRTS